MKEDLYETECKIGIFNGFEAVHAFFSLGVNNVTEISVLQCIFHSLSTAKS